MAKQRKRNKSREILNSLVLTISTEVGIRASWRFAISTDIFVSFIFEPILSKFQVSTLNFRLSTFKFQLNIVRIFPEPSP